MEENIQHNHLTRDIRPKGECPSCDKYHQSRMEERWREDYKERSFTKEIMSPEDFYIEGRKKQHENSMIAIGAHLDLYHLVKNELAKHIDVEKFLDESVEM